MRRQIVAEDWPHLAMRCGRRRIWNVWRTTARGSGVQTSTNRGYCLVDCWPDCSLSFAFSAGVGKPVIDKMSVLLRTGPSQISHAIRPLSETRASPITAGDTDSAEGSPDRKQRNSGEVGSTDAARKSRLDNGRWNNPGYPNSLQTYHQCVLHRRPPHPELFALQGTPPIKHTMPMNSKAWLLPGGHVLAVWVWAPLSARNWSSIRTASSRRMGGRDGYAGDHEFEHAFSPRRPTTSRACRPKRSAKTRTTRRNDEMPPSSPGRRRVGPTLGRHQFRINENFNTCQPPRLGQRLCPDGHVGG